MLKATKFIKHAVSTKDIDEKLTAVHCIGNEIQACNGLITMQHPCPEMGRFSVNSTKLIKAIEACEWDAAIKLTDKAVTISHGQVRIHLPFTVKFEPNKRQKGVKMKVPDDLLKKLKLVRPFISEDASRAWSTAVCCSQDHLYATNNIVIVRTPINMPPAIIPIDLVEVLIKLDELPKSMIMGKTAVTFIYKNKSWLQGSLVAAPWPEFTELFDKRKKTKPIPENMQKAIQKLKHFTEDDNISFKDRTATTKQGSFTGVKVPDINLSCTHLEKVLEAFTHGNFKTKLVSLDGNDIEGVMASRT